MYYSITFGEETDVKNTWTDWHIIPTSRPLVAPPEVKTEYIDIPGANGSLDYTEALSGLKFNNREGSWEFVVMNGYQEWNVLYRQILAYLHGKRKKVSLESDPGYFYNGRFFVEGWESKKDNSTITIKYIIDPYKSPTGSTRTYDWLWNELFNNEIIYGTFDVNGTKSRTLINPTGSDISPVFECTSAMDVTFGDDIFHLASGINNSSGIVLEPGDNEMIFTGNGRVVVDYDTGPVL